MIPKTGPRGGCTFAFFGILVAIVSLVWISLANGADLKLVKIPELITCGQSNCNAVVKFGTFSPRYLQKRWKELCKGGGRYQAMAEAYDMGYANPCQ